MIKLSYDGKGINDASDRYCRRIATFSRVEDADKFGPLFEAAPALLDLAKITLAEWNKPTEGVLPGELIARLSQYRQEAHEAIKAAEKGI